MQHYRTSGSTKRNLTLHSNNSKITEDNCVRFREPNKHVRYCLRSKEIHCLRQETIADICDVLMEQKEEKYHSGSRES